MHNADDANDDDTLLLLFMLVVVKMAPTITYHGDACGH